MKRLLALSLLLAAAFSFAPSAEAYTVYARFPDGNATSSSPGTSPYPSPVGVMFSLPLATSNFYQASTTPIGTVTLWLSATGTPLGDLVLVATSTSGLSPLPAYASTTSALAVSDTIPASSLSSVPQPFTFTFDPFYCNGNSSLFGWGTCYFYVQRTIANTLTSTVRIWHSYPVDAAGNETVYPASASSVANLAGGNNNDGAYMVVTSDTVPPDFDLPYIDTFTVSTSTQTYTVTGYSPATTNSFQYQVFVNTSKPGYGPLDEDVYNATTTGTFSYTGSYIGTFSTSTLSIVAKTVRNDLSKDIFTDPSYSLVTDTEFRAVGFTPQSFDVDPYQAFNPYEVCDFTPDGIVGCLKNFGYWLFVPEESILARWANLPDYLMTRTPFSYVEDAQTLYQGFTNAMVYEPFDITVDTPIGTFVLLSSDMLYAVPIASQVQTILGYLIWFFFANSVYEAVRSLFNRKQN